MSTSPTGSLRCQQVAEGVWCATVPLASHLTSVNCYLLLDSNEAFLVDTGYVRDGGWEHIPVLMHAASVGPAQLRGVVFTHTHIDHVGHIRALDDWLGLPGHVHPDEDLTSAWAAQENRGLFEDWLAEQGVGEGVGVGTAERLRQVLKRGREPMPRRIQPIAHGQLLRIGKTVWQVLHTPGHTPGHVCLFRASDGTLITGDHLLPNESPNISVRPGQPYNPLGRYLAALRMVGELQARLALPGHGEPITDIKPLLNRRIDHHDRRLADVYALVSAAESTSFQVALGIKWVQAQKNFLELEPLHQFLALGETLAHLVALEAQGTVERTRTANVTVWRRAQMPPTRKVV
jgi:glyoxylase-like metal-dependent hydrolase (beta-lactamase superfamily II)